MSLYKTFTEIIDELNPSDSVLQRWLRGRGVITSRKGAVLREYMAGLTTSFDTKEKLAKMIEEERRQRYE